MSINAGEKIRWCIDSEGSFTIQTATGSPVIAEGYQDSDRTLQKRLECQNGIVPDKVSDREAGTNRSGNTGRTRLLYEKGSFFIPWEQRAVQ